MDDYTVTTKTGLDERFRLIDGDGIYYAFQPIYGFDKGHSELGLLARYTRTYAILNALARLKPTSLLDVGGAEGYTGHLIQTLLGVPVEHCELSEEACKRAREIFQLKSTPGDVQALPFRDNEFDVVLCSETLEHVTDGALALNELMRVSRRALAITVPHEPEELIAHIKSEQKFHGHIHTFDQQSFDGLKPLGYNVTSKRIVGIVSRVATALTEPYEREWRPGVKWPKFLVSAYNVCLPLVHLIKRLSGKRMISAVMRLDALSCTLLRSHGAIIFVAIKDPSVIANGRARHVTPSEILDVTVPYYYLGKTR